MHKYFIYPIITISAAIISSTSAYADWDGRNHWHHYHNYYPVEDFSYVVTLPSPVYYYPQPVYQYAPAPQPIYVPPPPIQATAADNNYCREFTRTVVIGGQPQQGYGNACLQPDGSWQIVN